MGIVEREVAIPFNVECADILNEWEMERETEREKRQMELLTGQVMTGALGGSPTKNETVERW